MQDIHIAVINQTNPAHVNPTLSVVETLVRRGNRVTYVTSERHEADVARLGAEVILSPRFEFPFNQPSDPSAPIGKQYCTDLVDLAIRTLPAIRPFYERNVPDLILFDSSAVAGIVLAEQLSVPMIRMTPGLTYVKEHWDHSIFPTEFRDLMIRIGARLDAFCQDHGVDRKDVLFTGREPVIYFYFPELKLSAPDRRDDLYAARCAPERPCLERWHSKRPKGKRAVLISASTVYDQGPAYYKTCVEALSELQLHCVLSLGSHIDSASFGALPDNCEVVQGIPQIMLMPHVDVIVCLGGMSTFIEAMYHGLPPVMLTHGKANAEIYADNIEQHGLGIHLRGAHPTAASIKDAVARILADEALNARVKQTQRRVKNSAGAEEVANWIEQQLERLRPRHASR